MTNETDVEIELDDNVDDATELSRVEFNIVVTATDWSLNQLANMFQSEDVTFQITKGNLYGTFAEHQS